MPKVILASSSPQRRQLLEEASIPFETIVSNADETPVKVYSLGDQLNDIAMRKALTVLDKLNADEDYIIVAADQNILFEGKLYGKPSSIEEARQIIKSMQGSDQIYAYVGNTVLYVSNGKIVESISECDIARMQMEHISDKKLENYLKTKCPLAKCAGINISETPSLHLVEGKLSTARGMTIEYLMEVLSKF